MSIRKELSNSIKKLIKHFTQQVLNSVFKELDIDLTDKIVHYNNKHGFSIYVEDSGNNNKPVPTHITISRGLEPYYPEEEEEFNTERFN